MKTTKEINKIKEDFKEFEVIDYDDNYIYLKKKSIGVVEARVIRGSLGDYNIKFIVEKFGERNKLFSGKNVIIRIKKYLDGG